MPLAFLALAAATGWIPARWNSPDPKTLELVKDTPVNCLLVERPNWSAAFSEAAATRGIAALGIVRPEQDTAGLVAALKAAKLQGAVFEGQFAGDAADARKAVAAAGLATIELTARTKMKFGGDGIVGTNQGLWPGIREVKDDKAHAAPTGAPWIDTNLGFLKFVRALSRQQIWIGYRPPAQGEIAPARYLQAIADAATGGARWVVALDPSLEKRLLSGDTEARAQWRRMGDLLAFFERHREAREWPSAGKFALVQDAEAGGLYSGGILDMIGTKHTPVKPVPVRELTAAGGQAPLDGAKMAVNADPTRLGDAEKDALRQFTRGGGTLLTAAPGWKFPEQRDDQITLDEKDIQRIDELWRDVNAMTGRHNLGVRLFNVSSMLSNLTGEPNGKRRALTLVNYSDYDVENITVHFLGKFAKVTLYRPGAEPVSLPLYDHEEGSAADIDNVGAAAVLMVE